MLPSLSKIEYMKKVVEMFLIRLGDKTELIAFELCNPLSIKGTRALGTRYIFIYMRFQWKSIG